MNNKNTEADEMKGEILLESATKSAEREGESLASYYKKHPIAQEQHHAMHALTFLFFLSRRTLKGERVARRLLGRIIHHLMDLREFLEDAELTALVNSLYAGLQYEYDQSLGVLARGVHKGLRAVVKKMGLREEGRTFCRVSSALITSSEDEKQPKICLYPWLIANQKKILVFARHYGKQNIFEDLIHG